LSIPVNTKASHSPFSTSPPFPESEISQPPSKKYTSSSHKKTEDEDEEFQHRGKHTKKKKYKGKNRNGDHTEDDTEFIDA
jgi:hypothetical protein